MPPCETFCNYWLLSEHSGERLPQRVFRYLQIRGNMIQIGMAKHQLNRFKIVILNQ